MYLGFDGIPTMSFCFSRWLAYLFCVFDSVQYIKGKVKIWTVPSGLFSYIYFGLSAHWNKTTNNILPTTFDPFKTHLVYLMMLLMLMLMKVVGDVVVSHMHILFFKLFVFSFRFFITSTFPWNLHKTMDIDAMSYVDYTSSNMTLNRFQYMLRLHSIFYSLF